MTRNFDIFFTNGRASKRDTGDLRRHGAHYDVNVMILNKSNVTQTECILMIFSSVAALKVVILTTDSAVSDENFLKMTIFSLCGIIASVSFPKYLPKPRLFHSSYLRRLGLLSSVDRWNSVPQPQPQTHPTSPPSPEIMARAMLLLRSFGVPALYYINFIDAGWRIYASVNGVTIS